MSDNGVFLFAALAIIWLVIVGYLVILGGRLSTLERDLRAMGRPERWQDDESDSDLRS